MGQILDFSLDLFGEPSLAKPLKKPRRVGPAYRDPWSRRDVPMTKTYLSGMSPNEDILLMLDRRMELVAARILEIMLENLGAEYAISKAEVEAICMTFESVAGRIICRLADDVDGAELADRVREHYAQRMMAKARRQVRQMEERAPFADIVAATLAALKNSIY